MTLPTYDIVKKQDNNFVWVEAAHDIQSAKKRISELSRHSGAESSADRDGTQVTEIRPTH